MCCSLTGPPSSALAPSAAAWRQNKQSIFDAAGDSDDDLTAGAPSTGASAAGGAGGSTFAPPPSFLHHHRLTFVVLPFCVSRVHSFEVPGNGHNGFRAFRPGLASAEQTGSTRLSPCQRSARRHLRRGLSLKDHIHVCWDFDVLFYSLRSLFLSLRSRITCCHVLFASLLLLLPLLLLALPSAGGRSGVLRRRHCVPARVERTIALGPAARQNFASPLLLRVLEPRALRMLCHRVALKGPLFSAAPGLPPRARLLPVDRDRGSRGRHSSQGRAESKRQGRV